MNPCRAFLKYAQIRIHNTTAHTEDMSMEGVIKRSDEMEEEEEGTRSGGASKEGVRWRDAVR